MLGRAAATLRLLDLALQIKNLRPLVASLLLEARQAGYPTAKLLLRAIQRGARGGRLVW